MPFGTFLTCQKQPQGVTLEGTSISGVVLDDLTTWGFSNMVPCTIIEKTTNTTYGQAVGNKTRFARNGSIVDNYDKDAFFLVDHVDNNTNYNTTFKNLTLLGSAPQRIRFGVFAPRATHLLIRDVQMYKVEFGYMTNDTWMSEFTNVKVRDCISAVSWQDDGSGSGTGTTNTFINVWANKADVGFDITLLNYSAFMNCGADHIKTGSARAYQFKQCNGLTLSGCGAEDVKGDVLYIQSTYAVINGFYTYGIFSVPSTRGGTNAYLNIDSSNIVFNSCNFSNYDFDPVDGGPIYTTNTNYNQLIQNGSRVMFNECKLPTGGNTYTSYNNGSVVTYFDGKGITQMVNLGGTVTYPGILVNGKKRLQGASAPNSGTLWMSGDIVENTNISPIGAAGSRYLVTGWFRATNYSTNPTHTLGVDWLEMRVSTGT
ncbi:hypothetical protein [Brevibacillus nitrificans]|uniref:hypothetical protein n=1 Tax=Brevibacillus nitrificans TaxID=651560 RepID=UPI0028548565|nr:hypothetical protein [Brevibacillus nitrificans]MDR7319722.1 hypothetical protein [Brevibacillus nitrificans]